MRFSGGYRLEVPAVKWKNQYSDRTWEDETYCEGKETDVWCSVDDSWFSKPAICWEVNLARRKPGQFRVNSSVCEQQIKMASSSCHIVVIKNLFDNW